MKELGVFIHYSIDVYADHGLHFGRIDKLDDPALYEKALQKEKEQIRELMTNYGSLVFIWDDHFGRSDASD